MTDAKAQLEWPIAFYSRIQYKRFVLPVLDKVLAPFYVM